VRRMTSTPPHNDGAGGQDRIGRGVELKISQSS